jgi:hypothetical protein
MAEDTRRQREIQVILKQIQSLQVKAARKWRLDVPLWRLATEGVGIFLLGILVGLGLYTLFEVIKDATLG